MKTLTIRIAALAIALAVGVVACKTTRLPAKPVAKASFYSCGMHPEVRSLDHDGLCPICQMPLLPAETVEVVDPVSGKTNNAATFPKVSGYYSCPMHPNVLSNHTGDKCPVCQMNLIPVENPAFLRDDK